MMLNRLSAWVHKRLLLFYPAEFRAEFGDEMEQDFRARMVHRTRREQAAAWAETFLDWLVSMPREQLEVTRRDIATSARGLKRSPLFTLALVLSLGGGIAGASLAFTIANSLLIQTPLNDPSTFVGVLRGNGISEPSSWPDYVDYRDRNRSFTHFTHGISCRCSWGAAIEARA